MKRISILCTFMFFVCGLVLQVPLHLRAQEPKVIEITAKRFAFSPNEITLKKGETVKLRIVSEDVTHGLYLKPLKIDADILAHDVLDGLDGGGEGHSEKLSVGS